ncbi:MAG: PKD domain-containing protein, partial [Bacteroidales bacterium]|nr:PKD domain-containing protein [Bacteroidales bacterium]
MRNSFCGNVIGIFLIFLTINVSYSQTVDYISDTVCYGNPVVLTVTYTGVSATDIGEVLWDTDGDGKYHGTKDLKGNTIQYTFDRPDTFNVGVRLGLNNGDSITIATDKGKKVIVHPLPDVDFTATNLCPGAFSRLESISDLKSSTGFFSWDIGINSSIDYTNPDISHMFSNSTTNVKLKVINSYGCADSLVKAIVLNSNPVADFEVNEVNCPGDTAFFNNMSSSLSEPGAQYIWKFGDDIQDFTEANPYHVYANSGSYIVTLAIISENGCKDTLEVPVIVPVRTNVVISATKDTIYYGETSILDAGNSAFSEFVWSTGETGSSIIVNRTNEYSVIAIDNEGCISKDTVSIVAFAGYNPDEIIAINNIISPNSDKNRYLEFYNLEAYGN